MSDAKLTPAKPTPPTDAERLTKLEERVFGPKADVPHTMTVGETLTIAITAVDIAGNAQPLPAADTFTAAPSSLGFADVGISAGASGPAVVVHALKPATGLMITVADSKGLRRATERFDILPVPPAVVPATEAEAKAAADTKPVALVMDVEGAVRTDPEKDALPPPAEPFRATGSARPRDPEAAPPATMPPVAPAV